MLSVNCRRRLTSWRLASAKCVRMHGALTLTSYKGVGVVGGAGGGEASARLGVARAQGG